MLCIAHETGIFVDCQVTRKLHWKPLACTSVISTKKITRGPNFVRRPRTFAADIITSSCRCLQPPCNGACFLPKQNFTSLQHIIRRGKKIGSTDDAMPSIFSSFQLPNAKNTTGSDVQRAIFFLRIQESSVTIKLAQSRRACRCPCLLWQRLHARFWHRRRL